MRRGVQHRGGNEVPNIDLTHRILELLNRPRSLIEPVQDRQGHDRRYSVDTTKLRALGWTPRHPFADGLRATVDWYRDNEWWWRPIKETDTAYRDYYEAQYGNEGPHKSDLSAEASAKAEEL